MELEPEYKARNRAVAMSRAADFAKGRGFKDDAGREGGEGGSSSGRGRGRARARAEEAGDDEDGAEQSSSSRAEQWPGKNQDIQSLELRVQDLGFRVDSAHIGCLDSYHEKQS